MEEATAGIKLYDFAKEMVKRQKVITKERLERCMTKISDAAALCDYLLLMCPDTRQFVFFVVPDDYNGYNITEFVDIIKSDLMEVISARGKILDIDMSNHGKRVWEIWIQDKYDSNTYVYQLCDYSQQTIIFGEED